MQASKQKGERKHARKHTGDHRANQQPTGKSFFCCGRGWNRILLERGLVATDIGKNSSWIHRDLPTNKEEGAGNFLLGDNCDGKWKPPGQTAVGKQQIQPLREVGKGFQPSQTNFLQNPAHAVGGTAGRKGSLWGPERLHDLQLVPTRAA